VVGGKAYNASQVRTTSRSWDKGVLTDLCLTRVLNDLCLTCIFFQLSSVRFSTLHHKPTLCLN